MFDCWTWNSSHFVPVLAPFCVQNVVRQTYVAKTHPEKQIALIACSSLSHPKCEEGSDFWDVEEWETFDADAHVNVFWETLQVYGLKLE